MRILREQKVVGLQSQPMAVDGELTTKPPIDPAHAPHRNELQSSADVPRVRQQVVEETGPPNPARRSVPQQCPIESGVGHTVPAQSIHLSRMAAGSPSQYCSVRSP